MNTGSVAMRGSMDSVHASAGRLANLDTLNQAITQLDAGVVQTQLAGESRVLTRLFQRAAEAQERAARLAAVRVDAGVALSSYATQVQDLQTHTQQLLDRKATQQSEYQRAAQQLNSLDQNDPETATQAYLAREHIDEAQRSLATIDMQLAAADDARRTLDAQCVSRLQQCETALTALTHASGAVGPVSLAGATQELSTLALLEQLLEGELNPEEAWHAWLELGLENNEVSRALIENLPIELQLQLANQNGLPAWARDIATRAALEYALDHPEEVYELLGFRPPNPGPAPFSYDRGTMQEWGQKKLAYDQALASLVREIEHLNETVSLWDSKANRQLGTSIVQVMGLGNHDNALTSAVSLGDLGNASHVGVNVSGMYSSVGGIANAIDGAASLYEAGVMNHSGQTYAVVTWIGYRSPDHTEVNQMGRAHAGAPQLADFLYGIETSRSLNPVSNLTLLAHSYGSTTAAEALELLNLAQKTRNIVDSFVTYGSAGLEKSVTKGSLGVPELYATQADGDGWANKGHLWGLLRTDPRNIGGFEEFSAEDGARAVTEHGM